MALLCRELLPRPTFSPDLVPSDHLLFSNLMKWLGGEKIGYNDEIIIQIKALFDDPNEPYYFKLVKKIKNRW